MHFFVARLLSVAVMTHSCVYHLRNLRPANLLGTQRINFSMRPQHVRMTRDPWPMGLSSFKFLWWAPNEDKPILSAAKMQSIDSSFWRHNTCADIRRGSLERGRQTTVGQSKTSIFRAFGCYVFGALGNEANIIISIIQSPVAFPVTPKYMTSNDLDGLFGVKFCFRAGLAG